MAGNTDRSEHVEFCPRCGRSGYARVERRGNREYIYFVHYVKNPKTGKYRTVRCYIGPAHEYAYVEKFHVLGLTNVVEQDYVVTAYLACRKYIESVARSVVDKLARVGDKEKRSVVVEALEKLDKLINMLNNVIKEVEEIKKRIAEA